ncbi:hypothetical protein Pla110_21930 [Polystyrenella longa]|uniref:Tetratricopeptide repeat protein n=1 Tax=Polystyrenella longa TaxID=2528007 RepID=A0A518CMN0_9PLAN|nr:hypothetical protein [Polystyrenella longa]QDU80463.1 hypothetical protein Pla110_21930 [Polystyrenella longa]
MESWQYQFRNLMTDGELCFDGEDYEAERLLFQDASKLIPDPKRDHEEATQAIGAIADCFYKLRECAKAQAALNDILLCPGGASNPFIRLRRGQVFHQLGDPEKARTGLTTAFLNGGSEVFDGETEYLELISDVVSQLGRE